MKHLSLVAIAVLALTDVAPRCGSGPRREIREVGAWEACGGPHRCAAPTICATMEKAWDLGNSQTAYVCTMYCQSDADCAPMGAGFTCTGRAWRGGGYHDLAGACARPPASK